MCLRVAADTSVWPLSTFDTVEIATLASRAISAIVGRFVTMARPHRSRTDRAKERVSKELAGQPGQRHRTPGQPFPETCSKVSGHPIVTRGSIRMNAGTIRNPVLPGFHPDPSI